MQIPGPISFVLAFLFLLACGATHSDAGEAQILSLRQAGDELIVEAQAPAGFKKFTLEGQGEDHSWQPRSIRRTDGSAGRVTFSVPIAEHYELLRVRADREEKLAAKFFTGASAFQEYSAPPPVEPVPSVSNLTIADPGSGGTIIFNPRPVEEAVLFELGPYAIDNIFAAGQYLVEISRSGGTNNNGIVRVALPSDPHSVQTELELQNGPIKAAALKDATLYLLQAKSEYSTLWTGPTREQTVALTTLDLSHLPTLTVVGEVRTNLPISNLEYDLQPVWPSENTLVFASVSRLPISRIRLRAWESPLVTSAVTFRKRSLFNQYELQDAPLIINAPIVQTVFFQPAWQTVNGGVLSLVTPVLYPIFIGISPWSSAPELIAFDVTNSAEPKFASKVSLDSMVSSAASEFYATNNLVYLSHTITEQEITGSNSWVATVPRYNLTTNIAPVTNVVSMPHRIVKTNELVRTEIEATVTGISLVTNFLEKFTVSRFVRSEAASGADQLTDIAAGTRHGVALDTAGRVEVWGNNVFDQLGSSLPSLPPVVSIAAGDSHTLALDEEGRVWGWGANHAAQIIPVVSDFPVPFPVFSQRTPIVIPGLPQTEGLAAGFSHSLALSEDGRVWAWGDNSRGQLGVGDALPRTGPVALPGLSNIVAVAARSAHSFALDDDGSLYVWGDNSGGQLGAGTSILFTPAPASSLPQITAVAAGDTHTLLLTASGAVFASGRNDHGALGNGTTESRNRFDQVPGLPLITQISAGRDHSVAIDADGGTWVWGRNDFGQADTVAGDDLLTPRKLHTFPRVNSVSGSAAFTLALTDAGELLGWGDNRHGQLGRGVEHLQTNFFQVTEVQTVTNYLYHTNTFVEVLLSTNTIWVHQTNVVLQTNVVGLQYYAYETNWYNTYRNINKSFANVIDFNNATSPVVRRPVSIPGRLAGLSHEGVVLYTTAAHSSTNGEFQGHWVDAVSYDGTAAYLVDSKRVDGFNDPVVKVADGRVFVLDEAGTNVHALQLSATPSFDSVATISIPQSREMEIIGSTLVVKSLDSSISLFDPQTLAPRGPATFPSSQNFPLKTLVPGATDLWVPRGWQAPFKFALQPE